MKEITLAQTNGEFFQKGEKVIAINWFNKKPPFDFGTYIKKFSFEDSLDEHENCRKIDKQTHVEYNIGEYKVVATLAKMARIVAWDRFDREIAS